MQFQVQRLAAPSRLRRRLRSTLPSFFVALALGAPTVVLAGTPGTAGFLSLRLGTGARAAGMADAHVSLASDATAVYWNPAGIAAVSGTSLALQHNEWLDTARVESAAVAHATDVGVFGVHFSGLYFDEIELFESASADPLGHFNVYEISFSVAYARQVLDNLDVGVAVKGLNSKLEEVSASGWAADIGVRFRTRIEGLTFAGAAQNLGPEISFISETEKTELPAAARLGADYQTIGLGYDSAFVFAYDLEIVNDDDLRNHFGAEYTYREILSVRGGYKTGFDSQDGTFGVGVSNAGYRFDYAFNNIGNDLGNAHRFSIGIDL